MLRAQQGELSGGSMRRRTATIIGAAVIVVGVGAGTAAAITGSGGGTPSAKAQATQIADSLATAQGRSAYGLAGHLVSADVCVRGSCVHKQFKDEPVCAPTAPTCIGTALITRRFAHGVIITAELI
jgi:hypothetical protein